MKKTLYAAIISLILTTTAFAGYDADMAYLRGEHFAETWEKNIAPEQSETIKAKSDWDLCAYLFFNWKSDKKDTEKYRYSSGYDRDWVEGCSYRMFYQPSRKKRRLK